MSVSRRFVPTLVLLVGSACAQASQPTPDTGQDQAGIETILDRYEEGVNAERGPAGEPWRVVAYMFTPSAP